MGWMTVAMAFMHGEAAVIVARRRCVCTIVCEGVAVMWLVVWILTAKNPKKVDPKNMSEEELAEHEKYAAKWENDEEDCRNYLLNCASDELYDYYSHTYNSAKKIWEALQQKCDTKEAEKNKYACSRFFNYKMSENVSVVAQTHNLQMIIEEEARKQDKENEVFANNTHANHANNHQGNSNTNGNGAK
ncbi:hypothetical protein RJ640_014160, partial [Escallonia rubra]